MKEHPILFSAPMVRALLDGSKTQTRRVVKPQFSADAGPAEIGATNDQGHQIIGHSGMWWDDCDGNIDAAIRSPYGHPGDQLWVREAWAPHPDYVDSACRTAIYRAERGVENDAKRWKPSIHMPRWASRITLEITRVRVERLQAINEVDAIAEGAPWTPCTYEHPNWTPYRLGYCKLWEQINGLGSWDLNPWVWVVEFKVVKP